MGITIKKELDPVFEVLGLLCLSNLPNWKEELKAQMPAYGLEPDVFYGKHFKIIEKYLRTFQKYKPSLPAEERFFSHCPEERLYLYTAMATEQREYLTNQAIPDPDKLRSILARYLSEPSREDMETIQWQEERFSLPDEAAIIRFVNQLDNKPEEKWHILDMLCNPCRWYQELFDMIEASLPAYEKAIAAVEKPLEKLLREDTPFRDGEFLKIVNAFTKDVTLYPTLVQPLMQLVLYTNCYQGLFCRYLSADTPESDTAAGLLNRRLKALSDKSKLDILLELKRSSRYNLELAEQLKLSPSTTSHHMSTLLSCGLVSVDKQDGKVYYSIHKENMTSFLQNLKELLL